MPEAADGRKANAGRGDGLTAHVEAAKAAAPEGLKDEIGVLAVGYRSYQTGRDPADIWAEVLADA